jgi:4,5-dihydroxyphthalate decarboxylase
VRGFLLDDFAIAAHEMEWVQAGLEQAGRRDKFPLNLPAGFPLTSADGKTLSCMLADGELDAVVSARRPSCFVAGHPKVRRLFPDYRAAERDYYRGSGMFPIMHAVGIRRELLERQPWLAASAYKAFLEAKRIADEDLAETTALKIGLPWVTAELESTAEIMGRDFWSYGVEPNRKVLAAMARYSFAQGLAVRLLDVEEMFAPGTLTETKV